MVEIGSRTNIFIEFNRRHFCTGITFCNDALSFHDGTTVLFFLIEKDTCWMASIENWRKELDDFSFSNGSRQ